MLTHFHKKEIYYIAKDLILVPCDGS